MTQLRNFFAAAVLTFVLAGAALADDGIIYGGYIPAPTPTPKALVYKIDDGGDDTPDAAPPSGAESSATNIAIESAVRVLGEMLFLLY
jgi:hypothetical protein